MSDLIERLEKATGPDRGLDHAIDKHIDPLNSLATLHYTTSIDAALTLVPEGWRPHELSFPASEKHKFYFEIFPPRDHPAWANGSAHAGGHTAPLAICIAALKARDAIAQNAISVLEPTA